MPSLKTKDRNLNIDLIRILAMVMILTSHVTGIIYSRPDFFGTPFWWINHLILSFCRLGTPLFFLISGYLLTDKKRSFKENLSKTFRRLGIPFLVFYIISNLVFGYIHNFQPFNNFVEDIFSGGGNYLYFLAGLIIIYLLNPYLQIMIEKLTLSQFKKIIIFLLANTTLYIFGAYYSSKDGIIHNQIFVYWFLALGFFLYGSYLKKQVLTKINYLNDITLFSLPIILNIILTSYFQKLFLESNNYLFLKISSYLQSYFGVTAIISVIALFRILLYTTQITKSLQKISGLIITLATNSYGVYLLHLVFLEWFLFRTPLTIDNGPFNPAIMIALIWIALLTLSYTTSFVLSKIPVLKMVVGAEK